LLEQDYGIALPKETQLEFSQEIQHVVEKTGAEITPAKIFEVFTAHYLQQSSGFKLIDFEVATKLTAIVQLEKRGIMGVPKPLQSEFVALCKPLQNAEDCYKMFHDSFVKLTSPLKLLDFTVDNGTETITVRADVEVAGERKSISGTGNGPIAAYLQALNTLNDKELSLQSYSQQNLEQSESSEAICYISMQRKDGPLAWGVGIHTNTTTASLHAVTVAACRALSTKDDVPQVEPLDSLCSISATIEKDGEVKSILGSGNGPVSAFISGIKTYYYSEAKGLSLHNYSQTARSASKAGEHSESVCAIACSLGDKTKKKYGVGLDSNTNTASAKAILSSLTLLRRCA
jgi:hypothetical protein